LNLHIQDTA